MSTRIAIRNVGKVYQAKSRDVTALAGVDLSVRDNEFVAIVGASGCGKSTLLRIIGGLETYTSGVVSVSGAPVIGPGLDRAMVFQDYSLYPWLSVLDNIRFCRGLKVHQKDNSLRATYDAIDRARGLLEVMGLEKFERAYPNQLSGGMRQRVAIARALMSRPQVLLMDEPFGALDAQTREVMHDLILHLYTMERSTVVFVTHDVEEAIYLADRVVVMAPNPGRIDSIWEVPLPGASERTFELKLDTAFLQLKKEILHRIRETSGVYTDLKLLAKLTGQRPSIEEGASS